MKICPRCKRKCLENQNVLNSVSHQNPKVYICSVCGLMEGKVKLGADVPKSELLLTEEFEESLKKGLNNTK